MRAIGWLTLVVVAVVLVALGLGRAPRPGADEGARASTQGRPRPLGEVPHWEPPPLPGPGADTERLVIGHDREPASAPAPAAADPRLDIEALRRDLEEIEHRAPADFHALASERLQTFADVHRDDLHELREGHVAAAIAALGLPSGPRVHGALLALLGIWGRADELLAHSPLEGEVWRSAVLGAGAGLEPDVRRGLRLELEGFLEYQSRGGLTLLTFPLERLPEGRLAETLAALVLVPAETIDALLTRETMIFALGVGVDEQPAVRELFRRLLFDTGPAARQVRSAVAYVLAQAEGEAARALLLAFLADTQLGPDGKSIARWWLGRQPGSASEVELLAAPLFDASATVPDRMSAVGALMTRLPEAGDDVHAATEEVLALAAAEESSDTARLAIVSTLAMTRGGLSRLAALERVLREDSLAASRRWAAWGLGTAGPLEQAEAQGLLRAHLARETDPAVRAQIEEVLVGP